MKKIGIILLTMLILNGYTFAQTKYQKGGYDGITIGMVRIPGDNYQPFFETNGKPQKIKIHSFYLDVHAVTNSEFLAFIKSNPEWARSKVSRLFADENYLKQWSGDFNTGGSNPSSPVTNVSWFAASAYAKWKGKRLPTLQEWEYAAGVGPVNMQKGKSISSFILNWYSKPVPTKIPKVESTYKNRFGLYDMHGLIWEWVYDFNSIITGGDSRSDGALNKNFYCASASLKAVNNEDYASFMRFAFRSSLKAAYTVRDLGFRCAVDVN